MSSRRTQNPAMRFLDKHFSSDVMSVPQIIGLIIPLFIEQVLIRVIMMLNSTMVASYGPEAVSAVSMVDSLNNLIINFFVAVATGCTVVVAQYYGRKERENASLTAAQATGSAVLMAILICGILLVFEDQVIGLFFGQGDPLFQEYCATYLMACAISYPFYALIQTAIGAMRGSGNTRTSLYFSVALNALNILFNFIFLNVFRLGILGISISVIACRVLVAGFTLFYMLRSNDELKPIHFVKPIFSIQRSVMMVAIPNGLEQLFFHGGRMLTQIFIVGFGTMSTAANAVSFNFQSLTQIVGGTMQLAIVTIAGQCIGAGRVDLVKWYMKNICLASIAGTAVLALIGGLLLPPYVGLFDLPAEANEMALVISYVSLIAVVAFWTTSFVLPGVLRAAGDGNYTSISALLSMWLVRVVLGYVLGVRLGFGIYGVYAAMFIEWPVRSVFYMLRLRGDKWYRHRVIE
jgi:putative MATE family efflux protein